MMRIHPALHPLCRVRPVTPPYHPATAVRKNTHTPVTHILTHTYTWYTYTLSHYPIKDDEGPGSKDMATETTSSEEEQEFPVASSYRAPGMLGIGGAGRAHTESTMDGRAMRRSSRGSFTRASLEDLLSIDPEAYQSSVWLGTEDGWCVMHKHTHTGRHSP